MFKLLRRIGYWIRHRQHEQSLTEEIEFHRAMKQQDLERDGLRPADAALESRRALGNTLAAIENAREVWIWSWLDQFVRDMRIGARSLLKAPGFVIFSTLILSIGIGATVTVFAYFNSIFFKRLNVPNPAALVRIDASDYSTYVQYRDRNRSLVHIGISRSFGPLLPLRMNGPQTMPLDMVQSTIISSGVFKALGAGMVLGRGIEVEDEKAGAPSVVVLNEEAWRRYFGRDTDILDKTLYLNDTPYRIVGVAPRSVQDAFRLFQIRQNPEFLISVREAVPPRGFINVIGRLAPGISRSEAQADFSRIAAQLSVERKVRVNVTVDRADLPPSRTLSAMVSIAALFLVVVFAILLIVCDDISIMLLARIAARQHELGIRVALGGSRAQLIRQLVSENIVVSILGGAGAMIFMLFASRLIERLPVQLPDTTRAVFDWRVLVFTILTSLATTLFFGLRPALECVNRDIAAALSPGSKSDSRRQSRVRSKLVMTQIAVCTALLITAADAALAVSGHVFVNTGFNTDHLWRADINFTGTSYNRDSQLAFYRQLLPRLTAVPGVESVSIVNNAMGLDGTNDTVQTTAGSALATQTNVIDEKFFETLQVPLKAGRNFNEQDHRTSPPVAIINQKLAAIFPRTESPIGQRIRIGDGTSIEIVGMAPDIDGQRDIRYVRPVLYRPVSQTQNTLSNTVTVLMKFPGTGVEAGRIVREKVSELDPTLLVYNVTTVDEQLKRRLLPARIVGYLIGIPGLFVLLLGIVGTYGTIAALVAQRRREVGIRIALGAHPSTAVRGILREGIKSISIGIAFGIIVVVIILLWLSRNIGEIEFFDPLSFVSMTLLVIITAGAACYIPARRASRVDPMIVLREE